MQTKIEIGAQVEILDLPVGFKNRKLKGRIGIINSEKEYNGIYFYSVLVAKLPGERSVHTVDNLTAKKLKLV